MNKFVIALAFVAVCAHAKPSGHGLVLKGPSGIVTSHGAIGPNGATSDDHDDGQWHGDGGWGGAGWGGAGWGGAWDGGHLGGGWDGGHHSNVVLGNGAVSVGAGVGGHGGWGHGGGWVDGGWGHGGHGHGVAVVGPPTAPAAIIGPGATGKVVASGLWGPTHAHGGGHWGGHW